MINLFYIVAIFGNKVERCFNIVAGVDGLTGRTKTLFTNSQRLIEDLSENYLSQVDPDKMATKQNSTSYSIIIASSKWLRHLHWK